MLKNKRLILMIWLLSAAVGAGAQGSGILEKYIRLGLDSNLALRQKSIDIRKARIDLQRAQSLFYPQVSLNSQYTAANGGRSIDLPIGDLLNPVYKSLNQMTGSTQFPQVQNQRIQFLPNDYNDSKLEVTLPLFNPSIGYNRKIKEELINSYRAEETIYKRDLVLNIRQAYFRYLQALRAAEIYRNAAATLGENLRFCEKLVANHAATREIVFRARAQVSQVQSSLLESGQQQKNAAAYLNFLLNRPLDTPLEEDTLLLSGQVPRYALSLEQTGRGEELDKINSYQKVLQTSLLMNQTYRRPVLSAFYDVGFQGYGYRFDQSHFYQLAGVQLSWNIFKAGDNRMKLTQSRLDLESAREQYQDVQNQLKLQATTLYNTYLAQLQSMESTADEVESSREAFRIIDKKYREGQVLQLEWMDARTQMTNAEIQYSLQQLNVLNKLAELERATASFGF